MKPPREAPWNRMSPRVVAMAAAAALAGCAGTPPPDWQLNAHGAMRRALEAQLSGNDRVAKVELDRARTEIARSGRFDTMARAELMHCAAQVASLQFEPCAGFEPLRADAPAAERAYADHLAGTLDAAARALLPAPQQAVAAAGATPDAAVLQGIADPLARLVGAALWLRQGKASPAVLALAVETASAQGWRRPLAAWLRLQQQRFESAGDAESAARVKRRLDLVLGPEAPR